MENSELIKIVLTSTAIATVLSAIISTVVSIRLKSLDYRNDYYKKILDKRLEAYRFLETQIAVLKSVVLDDDKHPFHLIFSYGNDEYEKFHVNLFAAMSNSMWISEDTVTEMENLNVIFLNISRRMRTDDSGEWLIKLGKEQYNEISILRKKLERLTRRDLHDLHNLKKFIKGKKGDSTRTITLDK